MLANTLEVTSHISVTKESPICTGNEVGHFRAIVFLQGGEALNIRKA